MADAIAHASDLVLVLLMLILAAPLTRAQDNYEIQVYESDLVDPGHTMVELHSNFTIDGSKMIVDGVYPTNHAEHERRRRRREGGRVPRRAEVHLSLGSRRLRSIRGWRAPLHG